MLKQRAKIVDLLTEIAKQVERLPLSDKEQVLRFIAALRTDRVQGEEGSALSAFAGTLDSVSAQQMRDAIEKECEQVDLGQW